MNDLSRGRNNENSIVAFQKVKVTRESMWMKILKLVDGLKSTYEIANDLDLPIHKISGRFSELKAKHLIIQTGTKRIGNSQFAVFTKTSI
ncbi:hypothetical protein BN1195_03645 [Chryseobacterium oranimense G311]|uniref:hypothetical protein n=1 Tax=Chryseobacterium oranimense TaxID=421058 RepID=UPI0005339AFC|nr:hypothetical protein [Chryseobacterium oranimense]CEJ71300.1 hypothetical protein BN1195_03645 [Chryseobacterium oranimense G311]DAG72837.1 MAG TPA: Iron dependent repressor, N-terminal DNA binding domain [Caudoviricetes sp.]